ncbi:MAG: aspartate--ammonia ligase [Angelakisella sp.]|jgi:aspartate--ammonia ligase|nr:aspartate--ammonia ligase [Angelakisella sp.]
MSSKVIIPRQYLPKLDLLETQVAIKAAKDLFESQLAAAMNLTRVSAPLFVRPETGLNDDLNGVERPVQFDIMDIGGAQVQIVQSLAKWKRMALAAYGFAPGTGLYTDMNAIRRDEELDNLHSVYVDQWDWELVITREQRTRNFLRERVTRLWRVFTKSQEILCSKFPQLSRFFPPEITFVTTQELEDRWPEKSPREREDAITKEHGAVFLMGIGGDLRGGKPHDGRAPDYDDWALNGDILIWYPVLDRAIELSSMGIRVDAASLERQLAIRGCESRRELPFHKALLEGKLPLTMGGGIGQSRICMVLLEKAHIGEVQASIWPQNQLELCAANGVHLL